MSQARKRGWRETWPARWLGSARHRLRPGRGLGPAPPLAIASAAGLFLAAIFGLNAFFASRNGRPAVPWPNAPAVVSPASLLPDRPIPAEADVFRGRSATFAVEPFTPPRIDAHRLPLMIWRGLRAFPGAPPRVPHGLAAKEHLQGACNTCHERGGFVARFGGYAPVTPHPEYRSCMQCHVADESLVGIELPVQTSDEVCSQCHAVLDRRRDFDIVHVAWPAPHWPVLGQRAIPEGPLLIPHDLHFRGNCIACHAGPGAVQDIRTSHPERVNCRQCHVPAVPPAPYPFGAPDAQPFPTGADTAATSRGGS